GVAFVGGGGEGAEAGGDVEARGDVVVHEVEGGDELDDATGDAGEAHLGGELALGLGAPPGAPELEAAADAGVCGDLAVDGELLEADAADGLVEGGLEGDGGVWVASEGADLVVGHGGVVGQREALDQVAVGVDGLVALAGDGQGAGL